jgi:hypothetical protein
VCVCVCVCVCVWCVCALRHPHLCVRACVCVSLCACSCSAFYLCYQCGRLQLLTRSLVSSLVTLITSLAISMHGYLLAQALFLIGVLTVLDVIISLWVLFAIALANALVIHS